MQNGRSDEAVNDEDSERLLFVAQCLETTQVWVKQGLGAGRFRHAIGQPQDGCIAGPIRDVDREHRPGCSTQAPTVYA